MGGNAIVVKPSELAPNVASLTKRLFDAYMDTNLIRVVLGDIPETTELLKERFDHIFFTGSTAVGKIIAKAAAVHLTPCTLELGGKSPLYIDKSANMDYAVRRIIWGKMINIGQTCVAPDYILCPKDIQEDLIKKIKTTYNEFYGASAKNSPDICRVINDRNFERLHKIIKNTKGKIVFDGEIIPKERFIDLTVVTDVDRDDSTMQEELFGPILPIIAVNDPKEAIDYIKGGEKPLSMYIFSTDKKVQEDFIKNSSSGSVCCNDVVVQLSVETLPFGGVGYSGYGSYHGFNSFKTFTHEKSVLKRDFSYMGEILGLSRYPPYSDRKINTMGHLLKSRGLPSLKAVPYLACVALGVLSTYFFQSIF